MIDIQNIRKAYGRQVALKGVTLSFKQLGISAILGPNGSGKTTLIKCILGMALPNSGAILFQGERVKGQWAYRRQIGYLPQIARFPDNLRVRELLAMIQDIRGEKPPHVDRLIETFELGPFLDKRMGVLSGGTRQKVNITQALMFDSPVLIMDEPTNGLDPLALQRLKTLLREEKAKGKLLLITTHIMSFVEEMAEEIVFLLEGDVHFQGSLKSLLENHRAANLENATAQILQHRTGYGLNGRGGEIETPSLRRHWRAWPAKNHSHA